MIYRGDLKKLFVIDGGAAEVKIYQGDTYKRLGAIKLEDDADSMAYDPSTKYLYVVNGGKGAKMAYCLISILDTTTDKKLADIKIDSDSVEALALEKSGPANAPSGPAVLHGSGQSMEIKVRKIKRGYRDIVPANKDMDQITSSPAFCRAPFQS